MALSALEEEETARKMTVANGKIHKKADEMEAGEVFSSIDVFVDKLRSNPRTHVDIRFTRVPLLLSPLAVIGGGPLPLSSILWNRIVRLNPA